MMVFWFGLKEDVQEEEEKKFNIKTLRFNRKHGKRLVRSMALLSFLCVCDWVNYIYNNEYGSSCLVFLLNALSCIGECSLFHLVEMMGWMMVMTVDEGVESSIEHPVPGLVSLFVVMLVGIQ